MSSKPHSLAYSTTSSSLHGSSLGWDYHNLGVLNADKMSLVMDEFAPSLFSPLDSDFPSGYLEDALLEFTEQSKRRRLLPCVDHEPSKSYNIDLGESFWSFNPIWHQPAENFYCMKKVESTSRFSDRGHISTPVRRINGESSPISASESPDSSPSSYNKHSFTSKTTQRTSQFAGSEKRNKKVITGLAYPFAVVKPGGREGDVTLNDINERILMRPTRPVRHPVGDFACRPCVTADGPGMSGKAVVALTRIYTQGRGTITIIRTKG